MALLTPLKALYSFGRLVRDPNRLNEVFELADELSVAKPQVLDAMVAHARTHPRGRAALAARPRLGAPDLGLLAELPTSTLGGAYAAMMRRQGLDPADLPTLPVANDHDYLRAHLYESHDLWHVVTGFGTDVAGELGLQAFYAAQLPGNLPTALLAMGFLNTLLFSFDDRDRRLAAISRGYALGRRAQPLFGVDWAAWFARPLAEVRRELGIDLEEVERVMPWSGELSAA